ncbi:5-(carboxyamino)imidazole ribonucleotide synthase [Sneathiella chinensis]|uniref:N5-carboxyaminoimidazole ribonucleotide synthase n=1 Tax=Sneathiella chinensis TaxID=349750 RepID=A0ABQ5U5G9_9PROT|nr:5-(carboxyamino)imidazole ribonucleotide synthase [Sneathiella chinensis]GLQ06519.1 N5-carboxyaminoimidazole ribonucleotide synthase [Sneathiella chinensis]
MTVIAPGKTIGILGDGQLGRMMAIAAAEMGYKTHIFGQDANSPAFQVATKTTQADWDDHAALDNFAADVDVVTLEFENIPTETLEYLEKTVPVRPGHKVLEITQDRHLEKSFVNSLGVPTAPFANVESLADLRTAVEMIGTPAILKTRKFGYDGKGQVKINAATEIDDAWQQIGEQPSILEGFVPFELEVSVIVARGVNGDIQSYVPVENRHRNHILDVTIAPAGILKDVAQRATQLAEKIARQIDLVGLIAVEMFISPDGDVLVNELAPRPHNSGHWTIEACTTSQFKQIIRAVAGLPLASAERHANALMRNLIGEDANHWEEIVAHPEMSLHLYGKAEVRAGRKMGHVTRLFPMDVQPKT